MAGDMGQEIFHSAQTGFVIREFRARAACGTKGGLVLDGTVRETERNNRSEKNRWTDEKTWKIYEKKEGVS